MKKAGVLVGRRGNLNLIEGSNVTLSVADDAVSDEIDVTIASAGGGGGSVATDTIWDAKGDLAIGTGADTAARLATGANDFADILVPDSSTSTGLAWRRQYIVKTADESVTSSTALQDDDHLIIPIGAAATEMHWFEARLRAVITQTGDLKVGWSVPTGATMEWWAGMGTADTSTILARSAGNAPSNTHKSETETLAFEGVVGGERQHVMLAGWIFGGGTSGNVTMRWAQNTSHTSATTLKAGSFIRVAKLIA